MIQDTSREAYENEVKPTLSARQAAVMEALIGEVDMTNNELAGKLGWPINTVTPRVFELRKKHKVIERCRRPCTITGRTAIAWKLAGQMQLV